ncbi:MAG: FAD-dependent oxidoreductase, partial [Acidobacteriota bacterium]
GLRARIGVEGAQLERRADALLVATGRRAALDELGLEHVDLRPTDGWLAHDSTMRTAHHDIFVAGDATGRFQILHLANQEGTVAGHNAAGGEPSKRMDYRLKMNVIFTDPPYASVGMTSRELEADVAQGRHVVASSVRLPQTGRAITMGAEHGLWKLFADGKTGEVLGSAIVGPRADDLIHLISTLMYYRAAVSDISQMPWYHPTLAEVMLNLERELADLMPGLEKAPPPPA